VKTTGTVRVRAGDGFVEYRGEYVLADGGVWVRAGSAGLEAALGGSAPDGAWLFVPLHLVLCATSDADPAP